MIRILKDRVYILKVLFFANYTEKGMCPVWDTDIQETILYESANVLFAIVGLCRQLTLLFLIAVFDR